MEYIEREAAIKAVTENDCEGYATWAIKAIPAADVVSVVRGKWVLDGVQMIINLENAREQYKELGYPHRNVLRMRCSNCKKITMVDASIRYEYCPHCGADMREVEHENG